MQKPIKKIAYFFCAHYYPSSYQIHARSRYETYYKLKEYEYTIFCSEPIKMNFHGALELLQIMKNQVNKPFQEKEFMCDFDESPYVEVIDVGSMKYILDGLFPDYVFYVPRKDYFFENRLSDDLWFDNRYVREKNFVINNQLWYNLLSLVGEYVETNFKFEEQSHSIVKKAKDKLVIGCYLYNIGEKLSVYDTVSKRMMELRLMANPSYDSNSNDDYRNPKYNFYEEYKHYKSTISSLENLKDRKEPFLIGSPQNPISRPMDYIWDKKKIGQTCLYAGYQYLPLGNIFPNEESSYIQIPTIFLSQEVVFNDSQNIIIFEYILKQIRIVTSLPEDIHINKNQYQFAFSHNLTRILINLFNSFHSDGNDLDFIAPRLSEYKNYFKFYIENSYLVEHTGDTVECVGDIERRFSLNKIRIGSTLTLKRLFSQIYNLNQHLFDFFKNHSIIHYSKYTDTSVSNYVQRYKDFYPPDILVVVPLSNDG